MLASIKEFFRVISELRYILPMIRYKWPELDSNASLAHLFQETVEEYGEKDFLYFEDEVWTYSKMNEASIDSIYDLGSSISHYNATQFEYH